MIPTLWHFPAERQNTRTSCCTLSFNRDVLTLHATAAGLQHPGVHVGLGVGQELVSGQVRVVRGGNEVVAKRLVHVLVHLVVQRVENVTRRAPH